MPQITYLACPYSHQDPEVRNKRYQCVNHYAAELLKQGLFVYSPLTHNLPLISQGLPGGWENWQLFDQAMLERCDTLIVVQLPGWESSGGVQNEIAFATERGKSIGWLTPSPDILEGFEGGKWPFEIA